MGGMLLNALHLRAEYSPVTTCSNAPSTSPQVIQNAKAPFHMPFQWFLSAVADAAERGDLDEPISSHFLLSHKVFVLLLDHLMPQTLGGGGRSTQSHKYAALQLGSRQKERQLSRSHLQLVDGGLQGCAPASARRQLPSGRLELWGIMAKLWEFMGNYGELWGNDG